MALNPNVQIYLSSLACNHTRYIVFHMRVKRVSYDGTTLSGQNQKIHDMLSSVHTNSILFLLPTKSWYALIALRNHPWGRPKWTWIEILKNEWIVSISCLYPYPCPYSCNICDYLVPIWKCPSRFHIMSLSGRKGFKQLNQKFGIDALLLMIELWIRCKTEKSRSNTANLPFSCNIPRNKNKGRNN